jgi:hypothetical protein
MILAAPLFTITIVVRNDENCGHLIGARSGRARPAEKLAPSGSLDHTQPSLAILPVRQA